MEHERPMTEGTLLKDSLKTEELSIRRAIVCIVQEIDDARMFVRV